MKRCQPRILCLKKFSSKMREKFRHSQINKSSGNVLPLDLTARTVKGVLQVEIKEKTINLKPYEEIQICSKGESIHNYKVYYM